MLDPDFAALRYFFHYRFPHVRERAFASALPMPFESDSVPDKSGFSGRWRRLAATPKTRPSVKRTVMHEGFRGAAKMSKLCTAFGLLLQHQLAP
ncbi:hypothetical protein [Paraburkholderia sp. SOS3]|uniref:hypothetical protein n=1 Tax=Paraburkholderia sp. SOS3 TaxID=1926494 RepID=UPI0012EBCE6F|nr:hypothetical protein [Paraburkholderia sp. SOS3]